MANKDDLKRKRRVDQRTALLALAADKTTGKPGHCISSQEMAELLDGKCAAEQQQLFLEHFSVCDACYREWLVLSQELEHKQVAQKSIYLQRRVLAVGGSILAAAASVVFYLNLEQVPGPANVLIPAPPQLEMQALPESIQLPRQEKRMKSVAPVAVPLTKVAPQQPEMTSESVEMRNEARTAVVMARVEKAPVDSAEQWFLRVEEKCNGGGSDVSWKELALQGQKLVQDTPFSALQHVNVLVEMIVQGQEQSRMCSDIIEIIQENNND